MIMTLSPHYLLMDAQSIYEMPSVSRCLVFVMFSIAALGIESPQRRSMTTVRQANLVPLTFKRRTAALDLTEFLRYFAKRILARSCLSNNKIIS